MAEPIDINSRRHLYSRFDPPYDSLVSQDGDIRHFTPRPVLCGICGSSNHRAASCKLRIQDSNRREPR